MKYHLVSPEGGAEYMQKSGTPPSHFFNWHFLEKKRFFNDLRALSQSKVAKFQKLKKWKTHVKKSREIDMLKHRSFYFETWKKQLFSFFHKKIAKVSAF